jgi:stress response protein SCP2
LFQRGVDDDFFFHRTFSRCGGQARAQRRTGDGDGDDKADG